MRFKAILSLVEFTTRALKKPQEQHSSQTTIYRLIEVKQSPTGQVKLTVQFVGKAIVMEYTPQDIVDNDHMLEGFSKKDIRFIAYLACEQSKKPRYKIVMQEFCNTFNRMLFKLKKYDSNEMISKTASQISLDKNLINNLSQEDVCSISYIAGYEQSFMESLGKLQEGGYKEPLRVYPPVDGIEGGIK
jgi:hypothetical protein